MKTNKIFRDSIIVGFAVFAIFFGAGNLIFPPTIGLVSGANWPSAVAGLVATGIALPLLAVVAVTNMGGTFENLTKPVSSWFAKAYFILAMFFVAMPITVPRTAATAYEVGIKPLFPRVPLFVTTIIYFALVYYFANDKSNVIDKVGKILTPALLIILIFVVVKGTLSPLGTPIDTQITNAFSNAFITGYQTGDVLTGLLCTTLFVSAIRGKGYTDEKSTLKMTINALIVTFIGLFIIYGGLLYIGATGNSLFPKDTQQTALLVGLVEKLAGKVGVGGLSIAVSLATLTTAIGITAAVADFISNITKGKISYKNGVLIVCIVAAGFGLLGVSKIIVIAGPIFALLYPVSIVLVLLGVFRKFVPNDGAWKGAAIVAVIVSLYNVFGAVGIKSKLLDSIISVIPLSSSGFAWLLPAIAGFIVGALIYKNRPNKHSVGTESK